MAGIEQKRDIFNPPEVEIRKMLDENLLKSFLISKVFLNACKRVQEEENAGKNLSLTTLCHGYATLCLYHVVSGCGWGLEEPLNDPRKQIRKHFGRSMQDGATTPCHIVPYHAIRLYCDVHVMPCLVLPYSSMYRTHVKWNAVRHFVFSECMCGVFHR